MTLTRLESIGRALGGSLGYAELSALDPRIFAPAALVSRTACDRLRAWMAAGFPAADRDALVFCGDHRTEEVVRATLAKMPEPVAASIVARVAVVAIGRRSVGVHSRNPGLARLAASGPLELIALADADVDDVDLEINFAHEAGHHWTLPPVAIDERDEVLVDPLRPSRRLNDHQVNLLAEAFASEVDGGLDDLARRKARRERWADDLARLWTGRSFTRKEGSAP